MMKTFFFKIVSCSQCCNTRWCFKIKPASEVYWIQHCLISISRNVVPFISIPKWKWGWRQSWGLWLYKSLQTINCSPIVTDGMKPARLVQAGSVKQSRTWSGEPWHALWLVQTIQTFTPSSTLLLRRVLSPPPLTAALSSVTQPIVFWYHTPVRALTLLFLAKCI